MKVTRTFYSDGINSDADNEVYQNAEVMHRNNDNWPSECFILKSGKWHEYKSEPDPGYVFLNMYGATILLLDSGGYIVKGFVPESEGHTDHNGNFHMESWHVRK